MICVVKCVKKRRISAVFCIFLRAAAGGHVSFWRRVVIGGVGGGTGRFCWAGAYFRCFILCRDDKNDGCQVYDACCANYKKFVDVATFAR